MKPQAQLVGVSKTILTVMLGVMIGGLPAAHAAADEISKRVIDYYRRKANIPPEIEAELTNVGDSKLPGTKSATIKLTRGGQSQDVDILMSPDGRYVIFSGADRSGQIVGQIEDVTSDPFEAIAKMITTENQPIRGAKDAKVTIVEFSDFQCPYCARAHKTLSEEVMKEYPDKVRLVYKNFPLGFHKWAEPAGIAGECAFEQNPDAFWKLYDYYFENQQQLNPENIKDKSLEALTDTKVDKAKWTECFDGKKTLPNIQADMAEGQQVGVTGTPAFIINGRKISGAQPADRFKAIIDDELARAGEKG